MRFPANPTDGMYFELEHGVLYQYDASSNSWIRVASNNAVADLATYTTDGAMSADDLYKLNRLLIPPPSSTIVGNKCFTPYTSGTIELHGDGTIINVEGNVDIMNIDETGEEHSEQTPFHILQHTYGFDFTVDIPNLVEELKSRGQFDAEGRIGPKGIKGDDGPPGVDMIIAGPQGEKGDRGDAPPCTIEIRPEPSDARAKRGTNKVITKVEAIEDEDGKPEFVLRMTRNPIGYSNMVASSFNVKSKESSWLLAVESIASTPQSAYYIDADHIVNAIHEKFISEVNRLKVGYESIVDFWLQVMSDMFDEQKAALCCALENCISKTKNDHLRRHMELVAATAAPDNRIQVNPRGGGGGQTHIQGTALWPPGYENVCSASSSDVDDTVVESVGLPVMSVELDPLVNVTAVNMSTVDLPAGRYVAVLRSFDVKIGDLYGANIVIVYNDIRGTRRHMKFVDKGMHSDLAMAKSAYEHLTASFAHSGGEVGCFFNMMPAANVRGLATIEFVPEGTYNAPATECVVDSGMLAEYSSAWESGDCCGFVVRVAGQDYIVVKRSIGDDESCGGGESMDSPCMEQFNHPAFAWPTFDQESFAPIPSGDIRFVYDKQLNDAVRDAISSRRYTMAKGNPPGMMHLSHQISCVLFPSEL